MPKLMGASHKLGRLRPGSQGPRHIVPLFIGCLGYIGKGFCSVGGSVCEGVPGCM